MEYLIALSAVVALLTAAVTSIVGNMVANELYDRLPSLAEWLVKRAASRLPKHAIDRYREEWRAHLSECEGKLGKVLHAAGCFIAVRRVCAEAAKPQTTEFLRQLEDEFITTHLWEDTLSGWQLRRMLRREFEPLPKPPNLTQIVSWKRYRVQKSFKVGRAHGSRLVAYYWFGSGSRSWKGSAILLRSPHDGEFDRGDGS